MGSSAEDPLIINLEYLLPEFPSLPLAVRGLRLLWPYKSSNRRKCRKASMHSKAGCGYYYFFHKMHLVKIPGNESTWPALFRLRVRSEKYLDGRLPAILQLEEHG